MKHSTEKLINAAIEQRDQCNANVDRINDLIRWTPGATAKNAFSDIKDGILMFRDRLDEFIIEIQEE